jgi:hypothetical protein
MAKKPVKAKKRNEPWVDIPTFKVSDEMKKKKARKRKSPSEIPDGPPVRKYTRTLDRSLTTFTKSSENV